MFAEVAVYQSHTTKTFHYSVPPHMALAVGQLVEVGFRTARSQGIVLDLVPESPIPRAKPILDILTDEPVVTPTQIALARWMAENTLTSLGACLWIMLPPGLVKRGDMLYSLHESANDWIVADDVVRGVVELLRERGSLRALQLERAMPKSGWKEAIRPLMEQGIIQRQAVLPEPDAKAKTVRVARLAFPLSDLEATLSLLARSPKQASVIEFLAQNNGIADVSAITEAVDTDSATLRRIADKGLITIEDSERHRDPLAGKEFTRRDPPALTVAQQRCWETIRTHMEATRHDLDEPGRAYLLQGVTGSGKTEIYLNAIDTVLEQGRTAIVLVPEIALVPQTVQRFAARFPGLISLIHSGLTDGEQYDAWRRSRDGTTRVVIGARSALFEPLPDVGLIVIDEEHDDSYKQSPPLPPPYYNARDVAIAMMQINRGTVILGSATPDLNTAFAARRGDIIDLRLPNRVIRQTSGGEVVAAHMPPVEVVDMRAELRAGVRSMFSRALRSALETTLIRGEQAILFLNRRGTATFVLCRDCGYVAKCPRCDMPLTYHQANTALTCHYCAYSAGQITVCPNCKGSRIRYFGAGTASVEEALTKEFEGVRVLRWDRDTASERGAYERLWEQFASGAANVLIGTQMIVKGFDLPRVTLVGAMLADTALGMPDYRGGERTFQLLTQAAGRAGRGALGGKVILQTYQPEHYAIQAASAHDYEAFYETEIAYRRTLQYPPYRRLVRFLFTNTDPNAIRRDAERTAEALRERMAAAQMSVTELIGPAPCFFARIDEVYRWHIIAKTTDPTRLLDGFSSRQGLFVDIDPVDIL
jgi:primosomal protein N' (replication factor Y) (superfamily II helicase)